MRLNLRSGDATRTVRVLRRGDRLQIRFEDSGREVELRLLSSRDGGFELEHGHARIHGAGAVVGGHRQVWVNGRTLTYQVDAPGIVAGDPEADAKLATTIPAVVLDVMVAPGQLVTAGDRLVLLESMKMVLPLVAGRDGTVRNVLCEIGQAVEAGQVLVEID